MRSAVLQMIAVAVLLGCGTAVAGNQKEEELADSVRVALAHAIGDARPPLLRAPSNHHNDGSARSKCPIVIVPLGTMWTGKSLPPG